MSTVNIRNMETNPKNLLKFQPFINRYQIPKYQKFTGTGTEFTVTKNHTNIIPVSVPNLPGRYKRSTGPIQDSYSVYMKILFINASL